MEVLPLIKTHFSIGRSIITANKPNGNLTDYPISCFDLCIQNKLDTLIVVDSSISGLLELSTNAKSNKINLVFGLLMNVCADINDKSEDSIKTEAKYIVWLKNTDGYKNLIKISSKACTDGFYYRSRIDWKNLKELWSKNLRLSIPFYDSFIFLNSLHSHQHVPQLDFLNEPLTAIIEDNDLPCDDIIKDKVEIYCKNNSCETIKGQSINYYQPEDFTAYMVMRCIGNRTTMSCPNISNLTSNTFNFKRWLEMNK